METVAQDTALLRRKLKDVSYIFKGCGQFKQRRVSEGRFPLLSNAMPRC